MIPYFKPHFSTEGRARILSGIAEILDSGQLIDGDYTRRFEQGFGDLTGAQNAVALNSCTTALQISLQHFDVSGREVLVPSGSFVTDINAIRWAGGTPILVDMNPATLSFDLDDLERKRTDRTKAIVWVHLTGHISAEYAAILAFAHDHHLPVIEDCAHAHGASIDGRVAGSLGDVGCFSFYPTKLMTSGAGGMITTGNRELADYARTLRFHGKNPKTGEVTEAGSNWYLDEIRACVGLSQLHDLPDILARRRAIANRYSQALAGQPGIRILAVPDGALPAWYQYAAFLDADSDFGAMKKALAENHGVPAKNIYRPTHLEPVFRDLDDGTLRATEATLGQSLCLPIFSDLDDEQVEQVIRAVIAELENLQ